MKTPLFWLKFTAWLNGRRDGKDGIPAKQATALPQWERDLKNRYECTVRAIAQRFDSKEAVWAQEYKATLERAGEMKSQISRLDAVLAKYQREHLNAKISRAAYYLWLIVLVVAELPINSIVFDIFHEAKVFSYVLALGLVLTLVGVAHFVGQMMRHQENRGAQIGLILAVCGLLGGVAYIRTIYVVAANTADGTGAADGLFPSLSLPVVMALFWGVNLIAFALANLMSFYVHDSDNAFEVAYKERARFQQDLSALKERVNDLAALRLKNFVVSTRRLQSYDDTFKSLVARYRRANVRARKQDDREVILFAKEPSLECSIAMRNPIPKEEPI